MLKRSPMKRKAWPSKVLAKVAREDRPAKPISALLKAPNYGTTDGCAPATKTKVYRDAQLLKMARGRDCLLSIKGVCRNRVETVVAAHSNWAELGGKGMALKASDAMTVFACFECHSALDQVSKESKEAKKALFQHAHKLQVNAWRKIAADRLEPAVFRTAAFNALTELGEPLCP